MRTLETERLILRDWRESDLDDFYEYAQVEGVGEMAGWPHHEDREASRRILDDFMDAGNVYAVVHKGRDKVIGSVGIHDKTRDENYVANVQREIGYVLSKDYWGNGLMAEAVREVIKYAFEEIGADILWIGHFTTNAQSKRVIEKCGFRFYTTGKYEAISLHKTFDDVVYIMTREDFYAMA